MILAASLLAACASTPNAAVLDILGNEPGRVMREGVLDQRGSSLTGGTEGSFTLTADLGDGRSRLAIETGPMTEESGWDLVPWTSRGGDVTRVTLPGAISDAKAEAFLRRYGWRDPRTWGCMAPLPAPSGPGVQARGIAVLLPGTAAIDLWFDDTDGRLRLATTHADAGPLETRFSEWHAVRGADFAFRRTQRDPTGQETTLVADSSSIRKMPASLRPRQSEHGQIAGSTSVPFVFDRGAQGHMVIPVAINGRPAKLIFDTGAANFVTPDVARDYDLTISGGANIGGIGESSFAGGYTLIDRLDVGRAALIRTVAMVAPLPRGATHPAPGLVLQGLSGSELLAAFTTTIDFAAQTIRFANSAMSGGNRWIPLASEGQALYVEAAVDGRTGWFRIDTGDAGTVTIFAQYARRAGYPAIEPQVTSANEAGGAYQSARRRFAHVTLAGLRFAEVDGEISGQEVGAFGSASVGGNLGMGLLSCFRVTLDARHQRAKFDPYLANERPRSCHASVLPTGAD